MGNPVTHQLNLKHPIIQGGMGNISDPYLAAAISNAGGLGTIGIGNLPLEQVTSKIQKMMEHTNNPSCVNIPISVHPDAEQAAEEVIRHRVPVVSLSAGNPASYIPLFKKHNIAVICVSSTVRQAVKAEKLGADFIVCEGYEAAGINALNETTTMTLVPQMAEEVSVPIIAAGGIADGRGLAAAISLGASGVQMGTRFVAAKEAAFHTSYKQAILEATDESTAIIGRKFNRIRRIMKSKYTEAILTMEKGNMNLADFMEKTSENYHQIGALEGDFTNGFINGGQISGLVDDIPSVNQLMERMVKEAKNVLKNSKSLL